MKHIFYTLMLLPLMALTACHGDDELPNVNINTTFSDNVVMDAGTLYVVQGEPLTVADVTCTNLEEGKTALITDVTYYFDDLRVAYTPISPFTMTINTANIPVGNHLLRIVCTVAAVDKELAIAIVDYPVIVVADPADLPDASVPAATSITNPTITTEP